MNRLVTLLVVFLVPVFAGAASAQNQFPDSPTGRAAAAIVDTIEKGSVERIERFVQDSLDEGFQEAFEMEQHVAIFSGLHNLLAPVEVLSVQKTGPTAAVLVLGSSDGSAKRRIEFEVEQSEPHRIAGLGISEVDDASEEEKPIAIELGEGPWRDQLDRALTMMAENGFSGVAMAVEDGKKTLAEGYGMADRERRIANTADTVFSIGSITKDFTRAAILKLEEDGKLSTGDRLGKYFAEAPAAVREITLQQLLEHSAGFHAYHDTEGDHQPMTRDEAEKIILAQKLLFEPGARSEYSNSGYTLLAGVIERASGTTYESFVRSRLLEPAGMSRTGFFGETIWAADEVATGYGSRSLGEVNSPRHWPGVSWALVGAGGMVSSLDDLYRWHQAVHGDAVLGDKARQKYHGERSNRELSAMAGGGDYGFLALVFSFHQGETAGDVLIVLSNSGASQRSERALVEVARAHLDS